MFFILFCLFVNKLSKISLKSENLIHKKFKQQILILNKIYHSFIYY